MSARRMKGFTLIELISVIIIIAVVMLGVTSFIGTGVQVYLDVTERDQLLGDSRFVVERMNREIRTALPNSVRISGNINAHCLEFAPVRWSTFYEDVPVAPEPASSAVSAINLVGLGTENYAANVDPSDFVVVYATDDAHVYDSSETSGTSRRFGLSSVTSSAIATVTLDNSVQFATDSPLSRLYVVDGQAVSYCVRNEGAQGNSGPSNMYRHVGNYQATQTIYTSGGVLMAENIDNALSGNPLLTPQNDDPFRVYASSLQRNAYVRIRLRFLRNDEVVVFNNEIHIPNSP